MPRTEEISQFFNLHHTNESIINDNVQYAAELPINDNMQHAKKLLVNNNNDLNISDIAVLMESASKSFFVLSMFYNKVYMLY